MFDLESILDSACYAIADVRIRLAFASAFTFALTFVSIAVGVR